MFNRSNKFSLFKTFVFIIFISALIFFHCYKEKIITFQVASPDSSIVCTFGLKSSLFKNCFPFYSVKYRDEIVLLDSKLGLIFDNNRPLNQNFKVIRFTKKHFDSTYTFLFGERRYIRNRYNEAIFYLKEKIAPYRKLQIIFRVYNEGIAFRYKIPQQKNINKLVINSEETKFVFNDDNIAYRQERTDGEYQKVFLSQLKFPCENPLTIEHKNGIYSCITEADVENYSRMILSTSDNLLDKILMKLSHACIIKSSLYSKVYSSIAYRPLPLKSPWRVVLFGNKPGALIEKNYILYNLNPASEYKTVDWIKPGKVMREMTLTTKGAIKLIEFAKQHNILYVEFDAGWYGLGYKQEHNPASDAKVPVSGLDLQKIITYANKKNVGVILYVNKASLQIQLDTILSLYSKWGVKGLKFGFVHGRDQLGINFLNEALTKSANYKLIVDVHDNYRPSGTSRTYPNLLTQEGVRGNECFPTSRQNTILPFTRFIAGAADYTIMYFNYRLKVSRAHQLAASIVFFSPLQFIFWYDTPESYRGEKEVEFFDHLPVVWDETKVIDGKIGEFIILARKNNNDWYVGIMTNEKKRTVSFSLSFLDNNKKYTTVIYSDSTKKSVSISRYIVDMNKSLKINLLSNGGAAIRLTPVHKK